MGNGTLRGLFAHNDWARDKLMTLASELADEQLDRPFEMGPGSLRETLRHLYGAKRIWYERWQGSEQPRFPRSRALTAMGDLWQAFRDLAAARNTYLDTLGQADRQRPVTYTNPEGATHTFPLGDLMLHVCNHGFHHRAQALNMLRHNGVKVPGLDYLFMRVEQPTVGYDQPTRAKLCELGLNAGETTAPAPQLDLDTTGVWFRYCDWAADRVYAIAEKLSDEQLDREFEIGLGRLRKTLLHIRDGEQWWYENWTIGPDSGFQDLPETTPVGELRSLYRGIGEQRNAYLERLNDDDLQRVVAAEVRPGVRLSFRLGESLLQLCGHGTHHRAQALNMLRQLGADLPELDYIVWLGQSPAGAS